MIDKLGIFRLVAIAIFVIPSAVRAGDLPQCRYMPEWTAFREGKASQEHFMIGPRDGYRVLFPDVKQSFKDYDQIPLLPGDELLFDACGCVQTGGKGRTWKRYVDPQGDNADRLYHGFVLINNALTVSGVRIRRWGSGDTSFRYVRLNDLLQAQANGARIRVTQKTLLILGYEDDQYDDNGYWGHDDGTGDQCKDVGGAVVEVIATHRP